MNPLKHGPRATGGRERPREDLRPSIRPASADRVALDAAAATRRARHHERLEAAHNRMSKDVRSRPEDSSPAIRRLLGYGGPARPPQRWDQRVEWDVDGVRLRNVHVGPVDPTPAPTRRVRA